MVLAAKRLMAAMAHDLRDPLARAVLRLDLLCDQEGLDPAVRAEATAALRDIEAAQGVLERLMRLSGAKEPRITEEDVAELVAEAAQAVPDSLSLEAPRSLRVSTDRDIMIQVMQNLLSNAVRHGGDHVRIQAATGPDGWRLMVQDDGPGIPEEARRGEGEKVDGHGMGLRLVHSWVAALGGTLRFPHGEGGIVVAEFPRAAPGDRGAARGGK